MLTVSSTLLTWMEIEILWLYCCSYAAMLVLSTGPVNIMYKLPVNKLFIIDNVS